MRLPKRGERGFTLIELLIVVAILGVLAAVVIPNVGRFIGRGETEAGKTELTNIQSAVIAMMTDLEQSTLPSPVTSNTTDMGAFPDPVYKLYGYVSGNQTINYVATQYTKGSYTVDSMGTVKQETTGYE